MLETTCAGAVASWGDALLNATESMVRWVLQQRSASPPLGCRECRQFDLQHCRGPIALR